MASTGNLFQDLLVIGIVPDLLLGLIHPGSLDDGLYLLTPNSRIISRHEHTQNYNLTSTLICILSKKKTFLCWLLGPLTVRSLRYLPPLVRSLPLPCDSIQHYLSSYEVDSFLLLDSARMTRPSCEPRDKSGCPQLLGQQFLLPTEHHR